MKIQLLEQIRTQLLATEYSTDVFHFALPSDDYLKSKTITFDVGIAGTENTFDAKMGEVVYNLVINLNSPALEFLDDDSIYEQVFRLRTVNNRIKDVRLLNSVLNYNNDFGLYTETFTFEIKYH
jgi:hypothetical protein